MAFKLKGWSAFHNEENEKKEEKPKGANFMSFEELENSKLWKNAKPGDKYTYWDTTRDFPDSEEYNVIQTAIKPR
jgi:hypothetical protein